MILKETVNNPFRTLGLYLDCTLKQQTANAGKLRAFAMVHKQEILPADMPELYGETARSAESIKAAEAQLNNADERLLAALLWWPEPTEEWMEKTMEDIQEGKPFGPIAARITGATPATRDEQTAMKALLLTLQVGLLREEWKVVVTSFEQIIKKADVLKEMAHCQASTLDGNALQQHLYGILEQAGVPIRKESYFQQISHLIEMGRDVSVFYDIQRLYYKLEEVTDDERLLTSITGRIVNWLVRVQHKNACPAEEYVDIRRAIIDSFACSSEAEDTLDALYRNIYFRQESTDAYENSIATPIFRPGAQKKDDDDWWIGCLVYIVIYLVLAGLGRACSGIFGTSDSGRKKHNTEYIETTPSYQPTLPPTPAIDEEQMKRINEKLQEIERNRQSVPEPPSPTKVDIPAVPDFKVGSGGQENYHIDLPKESNTITSDSL